MENNMYRLMVSGKFQYQRKCAETFEELPSPERLREIFGKALIDSKIERFRKGFPVIINQAIFQIVEDSRCAQ
jgi:hypothetical protein